MSATAHLCSPVRSLHRLRPGAVTLLLLLGCASILSAQQPAEVAPGSRVRLLLSPDRVGERPQELRGTITAVSGDLTLRVHTAVPPVTVPFGWIERMEVSLGRASAWEGARDAGARGALLGALLGAMIGAEVANTTEEPFLETVAIRAAAYGFSLGATSAILGAIRPGERWRQVPVRARPAALLTSESGLRLGVDFSF